MMNAHETSTERDARRERILLGWATEHHLDLAKLDLGQQWVVFAALNLVAFLGAVSPLKRLVGYFLAHCDMGLGPTLISSVVGVSDRAVRQAKALEPAELLHSVRHPVGGHRKPKLQPEHAGLLARYLVQHVGARVSEILAFIRSEIGPEIDRLTLRRYLERYGLGCLRGEQVGEPTPFLSGERASAARSC